MLRTLAETEKSRWKEHLSKVIHAYNSTVHEATGYSPFFLLFGREPTLPIDLLIPRKKHEDDHQSQVGYAEKWREAMQQAYAIAMENMWKSARRGQKCYNQRAWSSTLQPGDHVLVRNLTPRGGPGKLRSYWEETIYVVRERRGPDSPVYTVEPLQGTGRRRVLHRNLLLPCPYLVEEPSRDIPQSGLNHHPPQTRERNQRGQREVQPVDTGSSSEEEFGLWAADRPLHPLTTAPVRRPMQEERREENAVQPQVVAPGSPEVEPENQEDVPASASESEEEQREAAVPPQRPVRVRQPRRLYTYDQLGEPTMKELQTCPIRARGADEGQPDHIVGPFLYPFSRY